MTYFVVSCDKLCDCMESPHPRKLVRSCNSLEVQLLALCGSLLANSTPTSNLCLMLIFQYLELHSDPVSHYRQEIECCIFFYRLFLKVGSTLVVVETIILGYGKSMKVVIVIRDNLLFIR